MKSARVLLAVFALLLSASVASAGTDVNEVGAILVYPSILTLPGEEGAEVETLVTVTNAGSDPVITHWHYINGDDSPNGAGYCDECDFEIELTPNDTETLVIQHGPDGIVITSEDSTFAMSCPFPFGMLIATQEHHIVNGRIEVLTDNVLLGEQVVVDYAAGRAYSIPAIPIQGIDSNDDWRNYSFDDREFAKLPRIVAADFLAPTAGDRSGTSLTLFTLGFDRAFPPVTDCSVTGFDAAENAFSASLQFGCWTALDLCEISPELCYPNLGLAGTSDTHGWLQLNCRVDEDADGTWDADGGVHGAIVHHQELAEALAAGSRVPFASAASWGRLLYQSITAGEAVTLHMEIPF